MQSRIDTRRSPMAQKQKKKRLSVLVAMLVLAAALLCSCGGGSEIGNELVGDIDPAGQRYPFRTTRQEEECWGGNEAYGCQFFPYGGQLLRQQARDDVWLAFADVTGEEMCLQFEFEDTALAENDLIVNLYLAPTGTLWFLLRDAAGEYRVAQMTPGTPMETVCVLSGYPFSCSAEAFSVSGDWAVLGEENALVLYDLKSGAQLRVIDGVRCFCVDAEDGLYYYSNKSGLLVRYDLHEGRAVWSRDIESDENVPVQQMFFLPNAGLFTMARGTGQIDQRSTENGESLYVLFSTAEDSNVDYTDETLFLRSAFAVDENYHVYLSCIDTDYDTTPFTCTRYLWEFEPFTPENDPTERVTLTITAPYQVDAIDASMRMYQREHPEVEVVWDVQYASRGEFLLHTAQYAEQLALRLMTGDVGDILMLHGSGLDVDAILKTDVLANLSGYLAECEFRNELEQSPIDALRDESGALRALPVALRPRYMIYNETLAQELALDWETDDLTWSELLMLAEVWQRENAPYSLLWSDSASAASAQDVLRDVLLANLDSFSRQDGSVDVGQAWLRDMAEQIKSLQGSRALKSACGDFWWSAGSLSSTLFVEYYGADYTNLFSWLRLAEENNGVSLRIIPMPRGEQAQARQSYGYCWGISAVSAQKESAWDFLSFVVSRDGLVLDTYTEDTCLLNTVADRERFALSVRSTASRGEDGALLIDRELRLYEDYRAALAKPVSRLVEPAQWYEAICRPMEQYLDGTLMLDEALVTAEEAWACVLAAQ